MFTPLNIDDKNKKEFYNELNRSLEALIVDEPDWLANLSNASALLYCSLKDINWAGFYLFKEDQLVLGPFQGKPACVRIPIGKGVCGTAAKTRAIQLVPNVHQFPGHIACDSASNSEIVLPIIKDDKLIGVLDIDSPILSRFDEEDAKGLSQFIDILKKHVIFPDWSKE